MGMNEKLQALCAEALGHQAERESISERTAGEMPKILGRLRTAGATAATLGLLATGMLAATTDNAAAQETDWGKATAGAVAGGIIGNQVGQGNGKTAATAVGAVVGAGMAGGGKPANVGSVVGGVAGALLGSRFGGGTGQVVATAIGGVLGAAVGNDYVDGQRRAEAAQARQVQAPQQGGYQNYNYNGPAMVGPHGKVSACMAQFAGQAVGSAPLETNLQAKRAMDQAVSQLREMRGNLERARGEAESAASQQDWAVTAAERNVSGYRERQTSQNLFEAEKQYAALGQGVFFEVCDRAAVMGLDVSSYRFVLDDMQMPVRRGIELKGGTAFNPNVARQYADNPQRSRTPGY